MVGRELNEKFPVYKRKIGDVLFEARPGTEYDGRTEHKHGLHFHSAKMVSLTRTLQKEC